MIGTAVGNRCQASQEIGVEGRPSAVTLAISLDDFAGFDLAPWAMRPGQDQKMDLAGGGENEFYFLKVPVQWKDVGHGVVAPHTRLKGVDNVDVVFRDKRGRILDYQVALVTRGGKFYATVQIQFEGQVVRTTGPRPGTRTVEVVPLDRVNAFPGNTGYDKTWDRMGALVKEMVGVDMPGQQKSRAPEAAEWAEPKFKASHNGWESMVCLYYNLVTGFGKVMDRAGRHYQVKADLIIDVPKGTLPMLEPGKLCWARTTSEPGAADAIKSVKADPDQ